jgi:cytochrome c5
MAVDKKISTFTIPLNETKKRVELPMGKIVVTKADEVCLTCGGFKRLQWMEKVDGNKVIKEVCLYCITTPKAPTPTTEKLDEYTKRMRENYFDAKHTDANRADH